MFNYRAIALDNTVSSVVATELTYCVLKKDSAPCADKGMRDAIPYRFLAFYHCNHSLLQ